MRDCWDILVELFHDGAHVIQVILVGLNDAKWSLHGRVKYNYQMYHTNGSALLLLHNWQLCRIGNKKCILLTSVDLLAIS